MAIRSKFFGGSSESSSEESSTEEEKFPKAITVAKTRRVVSDEETEQKRFVRSEKDKRLEEMKTIIRNIMNAKKINDFNKVLDGFEALAKSYEKAKKVIDIEGIPGFYIASLAQIQEFIEDCWDRENGQFRKSLEKGAAKSLATMRQRIRKYNRYFEDQINKYKENPEIFDVASEKEVSEAESSDELSVPEAKGFSASDFMKGSAKEESSASSNESAWSSESDEASVSSIDLTAATPQDAYKYFMKSEPTKPHQEVKRKKVARKEKKSDDEDGWEEVKEGAGIALQIERPKMFNTDEEVNANAVIEKIREITLMRGKRDFDSKERCDLLLELRSIVASRQLGLGLDLHILFEMIGLCLDHNRRIAVDGVKCDWNNALKYTEEAVDLLLQNPNVCVMPDLTDEEEELKIGPNYKVRGSILITAEMISIEFTGILQNCEAYGPEYVERLRDEIQICRIIDKVKTYLESKVGTCGIDPSHLCRIYSLKLEHLYFKTDENENLPSLKEIEALVNYISTHDDVGQMRLNALLYQIYHLAAHDQWHKAKHLMLMSTVQEYVLSSSISTQILYNRALVQLGMCAFRHGFINDAHAALVDIHSTNRSRELLAQGVSQLRNVEKTPEQEKEERQRLLPYHLHLNLELIEFVYLVSALLIEVPYMSSYDFDLRKKPVSKQFHYQLKQAERQPSYGPPENMREHLIAAARVMKTGDWKSTVDLLINPKMNAKIWCHMTNSEKVQSMLITKVKEECLRTYLFVFSSVYDSISLEGLAEMFELPERHVKTIISRMIYKKELMASVDQPSKSIVMHRTDLSRIQSLSVQLSEKIIQLIEANDKMSSMSSSVRSTQQQETSVQRAQRTF